MTGYLEMNDRYRLETDMLIRTKRMISAVFVLLLIPLMAAGCGKSASKEAESVHFKEKEIVAYGKDLTGSFTDAEIADMIFEAIDDEKFANGAIDLSYTQESLRERVNAMKAEGVYVRVAFDAPYKHGNYTFQTVTVLGNPKLLGVEFQLDSQCYGYASNIAKKIAEKA